MKRRPLTVTLTTTANYPGTLSNVYYDFNGDDIADLTTNNTSTITHTYSTNGQFFPVVTVQTSVGRFSSQGGWNSFSLDPSNQPPRVNVQASPVLVSTISVTDPVDIKWTAASNLYVLSGSSATITEYNSSGASIRSLSSIGSSPTGLDVDSAGNVYVAMNGNNQVWRYKPTTGSFMVDTNFGTNGCIGKTNGATGTGNAQLNAPYDVAVSPDGGTISVSDSGNNRIQQFDTNGDFIASFGSTDSNIGPFSSPAGLAYDNNGTLYVVDSGSNRMVQIQSDVVMGTAGVSGIGVGQLQSPVNLSACARGIYVADSGNNRIQKYDLPKSGGALFSQAPSTISTIRYAFSTNFTGPYAVAPVDDPLNEKFYIADTGNNRIVLYEIVPDDPTPVWTNMTAHIISGDIAGAGQFFSQTSIKRFQRAFLAIGTSASLANIISGIGSLTPDYITDDLAECYFQKTISGQIITFPITFVRENGIWKVVEF